MGWSKKYVPLPKFKQLFAIFNKNNYLHNYQRRMVFIINLGYL